MVATLAMVYSRIFGSQNRGYKAGRGLVGRSGGDGWQTVVHQPCDCPICRSRWTRVSGTRHQGASRPYMCFRCGCPDHYAVVCDDRMCCFRCRGATHMAIDCREPALLAARPLSWEEQAKRRRRATLSEGDPRGDGEEGDEGGSAPTTGDVGRKVS